MYLYLYTHINKKSLGKLLNNYFMSKYERIEWIKEVKEPCKSRTHQIDANIIWITTSETVHGF